MKKIDICILISAVLTFVFGWIGMLCIASESITTQFIGRNFLFLSVGFLIILAIIVLISLVISNQNKWQN